MGKAKILIVEDERIVAEDIRRTLISFDYDVVAVVSRGEDAILKAEELNPDIILMDIMLDGKINGIEAAREINKKCVATAIVFLTAYANENTLREAIDSGPYGYIIKPFEEKELHATVEMALYKCKMETALLESKKFLHNVIDASPNCIFVLDENNKYVMVNKTMANMFQVEPQDMVGKTYNDLISVKDSGMDWCDFMSECSGVIEAGQSEFIPETTCLMPDGVERWFQVSKLLLNDVGKPNKILGVAVDITARKKAEEELSLSFDKLKKLMGETVNGLVSAVEMRDPYTAGHQRRVEKLACAIGRKMNLSKERIDSLSIAAIVHDIGKIYIPAEILSRPGKLNGAEFNLIKIHPRAGYDVLSGIEFPGPVAEIVLQHQERLDGSGYPQGLKAEEIILEARILGVADVVEAMTSHRPYRANLGVDAALEEIISNKGVLYDSDVVDACVELIRVDKFDFS